MADPQPHSNADSENAPAGDRPYSRKFAADQAVANARIEGFVPSPAFEEDWAALHAGKITPEEALKRCVERAKQLEATNLARDAPRG